tara:strand:+ start:950 stop:1201 length:252 start_codon:yes stop_codon:yes gene_type:complete
MTENIQHTTKIPCHFSKSDLSRIIEMAWDDKTPFEAIKLNFNCSEREVINLMKKTLKRGSYRKWRQRVNGRKAKHLKKLRLHA